MSDDIERELEKLAGVESPRPPETVAELHRRVTRRRVARAVTAVAAVVVVVGAVGVWWDRTSTPTAIETVDTPPGPVGPDPTGPEADVEAVQGDAYPPNPDGVASPRLSLADVSVEATGTSQRVTFTFDGEAGDEVAGYRVQYTDLVPELPDGEPVTDPGSDLAHLEVRVIPATATDRDDFPGPGYDGPLRITPDDPGSPHLTELVQVEDFELFLAWVLVLDEEVPFSVTTEADPARLVIDIPDQR